MTESSNHDVEELIERYGWLTSRIAVDPYLVVLELWGIWPLASYRWNKQDAPKVISVPYDWTRTYVVTEILVPHPEYRYPVVVGWYDQHGSLVSGPTATSALAAAIANAVMALEAVA